MPPPWFPDLSAWLSTDSCLGNLLRFVGWIPWLGPMLMRVWDSRHPHLVCSLRLTQPHDDLASLAPHGGQPLPLLQLFVDVLNSGRYCVLRCSGSSPDNPELGTWELPWHNRNNRYHCPILKGETASLWIGDYFFTDRQLAPRAFSLVVCDTPRDVHGNPSGQVVVRSKATTLEECVNKPIVIYLAIGAGARVERKICWVQMRRLDPQSPEEPWTPMPTARLTSMDVIPGRGHTQDLSVRRRRRSWPFATRSRPTIAR
jgi:hypothetical protein